MFFGLKNVPETFYRAMDIIQSPIKCRFALVYLDNVVVFWRLLCCYANHRKRVLFLLQDARVTLKSKKCNFFTGTTDYFDHVTCSWRLEIATHRTDSIKGLKPLTNITKLCSFFGLCNVFRRLVHSFARMAAPLSNKLKKDWPKHFGALIAEEPHELNKL